MSEEAILRFQVDIEVSDTPTARAWVEQLRSWLDITPEGVKASMHDVEEQLSDGIGVEELVAFFRQRVKPQRVRYNARMVLYYIAEHLNHLVVVRCTNCSRQFGVCRCGDRGREYEGEWYRADLTPDSHRSEGFWVIDRASLRALNESHLPVDHSQTRRQRLLEFLRYQKGE